MRRMKGRGEILSLGCLCLYEWSQLGGCEHPQISSPLTGNLYPPPPSSYFIFHGLDDVSSQVSQTVTPVRQGSTAAQEVKKTHICQGWNCRTCDPVSTGFLLVSTSVTQMAPVGVITMDNGCGSPLTSTTTGTADTKPDFSNQWKPGRIIIPGQGVKQPTEV